MVSPGPDFAIVTRNSLVYSRKSGIFTSLGLGFGIMVHITYCLFGIGIIISKSIILFNIIKYIGAIYLIYIGYKSLRAKPEQETEKINEESFQKTLTKIESIKIGFFTNVLNPKVTLFFLALFTQVIDVTTPKIIQLLYGAEMVIMTFVWFSLVSIFFSNNKIKHKIFKVKHYVERFTGAVLIALGIKVALATRE